MNDLATSLLVPLGRTTLLAAGAAAVVFTLLRATRCSSPGLHRLGACLVLLIGWLFIRMPIAIPYYDAPVEIVDESGGWRSSEASPQYVSGGPLERPEDHLTVTNVRPTEIVHEKTEEPTVIPTATIVVKPLVAVDPPTRSRRADWPVALLGAWLTGMIALAVCWTAGYIRFMIRLPQGEPARTDWTRQWDELLSAAGVSRSVPIRMTRRLGPILCRTPGGCRLFLPLELWQRLTPAARLSVLRHELAHYRRRDAWKSLAVRIAALPHWFNPACWWAVRQFDEAAEWACDREAAGAGEKTAVEFARTLLDLGEPTVGSGCYGPAARGRGLSVRVRRLLASQTMEDSVMKRLLVGVVALGLVAVCLLQFDLVAKQPVAESVAAEEETPKQSPPLESLRYDGKSFRQWRDELATELKPERRAEALKAFGAFGAAGYGEEAAEVILDVMRKINISEADASLHLKGSNNPVFGPTLIKQTGLRAFLSDSHGYRIPPAGTVPVLVRELKEGNRNGRLFAVLVLGNIEGSDAAPAVPTLLETLRSDEESSVRLLAFRIITRIAPDVETAVSAVRLVLKDTEPQVVSVALLELVSLRSGLVTPRSGSETRRAQSIFRHPHRGDPRGLQRLSLGQPGHIAQLMGQTQGPFLRRYRPLHPWGDEIIKAVVAAVDDPRPAVRLDVIQSVGRIGPAAKDAAGPLTQAFEQGSSDEREKIVRAWAMIGAGPPEAEELLWQMVRHGEQADTRVNAMRVLVLLDKLDPQVGVPLLIESFPKRELNERAAIACLLVKFGADAAPAADLLRGLKFPSNLIYQVELAEAVSATLKAIDLAEKAPIPPAGSSSTRPENSGPSERKAAVVRLKYALAQHVSDAVNEYVRNEVDVEPGLLSPLEQIEREILVVPEAVSNSLIVSAMPRYFDEIMEMVERLDGDSSVPVPVPPAGSSGLE